ncbi:uncharacterized protein [Chelonus insularis]|uniref:uncharacterized protein n=1 Tax=Chelonus insularis TaxID=460826 RepID=UPI0015898862|nr:uncharacterized protein LOC118070812 [Chelonus insularis]
MAIKWWWINCDYSNIQLATLLFCMIITQTNNYSVDRSWNNSFISAAAYCALDLKPQEDLNLEKMIGKWYVVEVLEHKKSSVDISDIGMSVIINICPIVYIQFDEKGFLRLLWTEEYGNLEYTFRIPVSDYKSDGFWVSVYPQNGSIVDNNKYYNQFNGTVVVTKAVAQHVLLTFCPSISHDANSNDNNNNNQEQQQQQNQLRYYSILLARQHRLDKSSINGIHKLLKRRGIGISGIKSTCRSSTTSTINHQYIHYLVIFSLLYSFVRNFC